MRWVTVATFREPYAAHIARSYLDANEIPAIVIHEHHIGMDWLISQALGGVKLQVEEDGFDDAIELLQNPERVAEAGEAVAAETDPNSMCPRCGSPNIVPRPQLERRTKAASLAVGIPFGVGRDRWECLACGRRFRHRFPDRRLDRLALNGLAVLLLVVAWIVLLPFQLLHGMGSFASSLRHYFFHEFECWECGVRLPEGAAHCPGCGLPIPDDEAMRELVDPRRDYDGQCARCHTPYALADYRPSEPRWACSRCGDEIPRTS